MDDLAQFVEVRFEFQALIVGLVEGLFLLGHLCRGGVDGLGGACERAEHAVQEGGAYLDNVRVLDPDTVPQATLAGGWVLLRKGKRNLAGVRLPAGS